MAFEQDPVKIVAHFIQQIGHLNRPFLLALSGGADSLCLFYSLLECQNKIPLRFAIAHVDHGWRKESSQEADQLRQLAQTYGFSFHLKVLDPAQLKGNLEEQCRQQRYLFFKELCEKESYQGVFVGHQEDDQAETVLKRLLEGGHWVNLAPLKLITEWEGVKILRPFLKLSKREIVKWLQDRNLNYFEDSTNIDARFLRGRLRTTVLPFLEQEFGKNVKTALQEIAEESSCLKDYMDQQIAPLWSTIRQGPWGKFVDLRDRKSFAFELQYFIREWMKKEKFFISREQLKWIVEAIQRGEADRSIVRKGKRLEIDRGHLFCLTDSIPSFSNQWALEEGIVKEGWRVSLAVKDYKELSLCSWEKGWETSYHAYVPFKKGYQIGSIQMAPKPIQQDLHKWWSHYKVPAFLRRQLPIVWHPEGIKGEFLTGKVKDQSPQFLEIILLPPQGGL